MYNTLSLVEHKSAFKLQKRYKNHQKSIQYGLCALFQDFYSHTIKLLLFVEKLDLSNVLVDPVYKTVLNDLFMNQTYSAPIMGNERFIFWFWESPTTGWHACKVKKHFHCLINRLCILFLTYLLNDSQIICSTIHFSKPLICDDRYHFHFTVSVMPDKAAFVSAVLLCVQHFRGSSKSCTQWQTMNFHSDQRKKTNKWAGNMLMFHVDVNRKRLGIRFKNNFIQWFSIDILFWETITLYTTQFQM